jgi:hypothetical protein
MQAIASRTSPRWLARRVASLVQSVVADSTLPRVTSGPRDRDGSEHRTSGQSPWPRSGPSTHLPESQMKRFAISFGATSWVS